MKRPGRSREMFVAVCLLGCGLFTPPAILIFNKSAKLFGIPVFYGFLFTAWLLVIGLTAFIVERTNACDLPLSADGELRRPGMDGEDEAGDA